MPSSLRSRLRVFLLPLVMAWVTSGSLAGQRAPSGILDMADSAYFSGDPAAALELLDGESLASGDPDRRWRAIRSLVALGMAPGSVQDQNHWLDRGIILADAARNGGSPTLDELYWAAAVEGLRSLNAGPRYAGELALRAETDARLVLAADPFHGGAHNVLGRISLEVMSLSRAERFLARLVMGGRFPRNTSWERAETHLRRAAQLWPYMVLFHLDLATLLERRGRAAEAREEAVRALATPSLHPPDQALKEQARDLLTRLGG